MDVLFATLAIQYLFPLNVNGFSPLDVYIIINDLMSVKPGCAIDLNNTLCYLLSLPARKVGEDGILWQDENVRTGGVDGL